MEMKRGRRENKRESEKEREITRQMNGWNDKQIDGYIAFT